MSVKSRVFPCVVAGIVLISMTSSAKGGYSYTDLYTMQKPSGVTLGSVTVDITGMAAGENIFPSPPHASFGLGRAV